MSAARGGKSGGGKRTDEDGDGASASASATRRVFVTVGTTMFADLVRAVTSDDALRALRARGVSHLVVQYGRGDWPGDAPVLGSQQHGIQVRLRSCVGAALINSAVPHTLHHRLARVARCQGTR